MDATSVVQRAVTATAAQAGPGTWGIACSGGVDSLVLAHAAATALGTSGVVVVHVDHGLQPGSHDVANGLQRWCEVNTLACAIRRVRVPDGPSLEAQARAVRYGALHQVATEYGLPFVATAHNAGDQAETVLMRLIRGTGPAGLVGMRQQRGPLLRPLLRVPRSVIAEYAQLHALPVWHDPMNADQRFFRVRVRTHLLPMLQAENPQLERALGQLAEQMGQWQNVIDNGAELGVLPWLQAVAKRAAPAVLTQAWGQALTSANVPVTAAAHRALHALLAVRPDGTHHIDIPGGAVELRYGYIHLASPTQQPTLPNLDVQCETPWQIRTRQPGDVMQPIRLAGRHRKLSDLFIDAKVPRALRAHARLVVAAADPSQILWAEHLGPAWGSAIVVTLTQPKA